MSSRELRNGRCRHPVHGRVAIGSIPRQWPAFSVRDARALNVRRAEPFEAINNPQYYVRAVARAEKEFASRLVSYAEASRSPATTTTAPEESSVRRCKRTTCAWSGWITGAETSA